uniref:CUE domain-containing protein n=1 Tax=Ditylenchus dipsaci TaxID=166011 RepID=A0A915CRL7_9BILA
MNLAASTLSVPFANFLACKRARINQSGVHLFKTFYRLKALSEKDRFRLIYNNLSNREFLVRLDDDIRIKEELFKFVKSKVCTKDHEKHVVKALDEAYYEKAISVKTALMQRQILQDIGKLKDAQIESAVKSLEDLLPEFSREQLHLCLRHFDYDLEKTTNAIMEMKDGLPFELRILMKCKDRFDDLTPARVLIQQFWDSGETDSNALCEKLNQPEKISSLFNLKPIPAKKMVNDENETKIESESQRSKKLEKLMMKYDGLFDMSGVQTAISSINKAKKTDVSKVEAFEVDGKLLVKQSAVQRQLLQPGVTADEKAAIRESYNRYQYELSEDDDEDGRHDLDARFAEETTAALDDDEYDDTYDDPRTFAAELVGSEGEDEKEASKPSGSRQQNVETGKYNQPAVSANLPKAWTNTANRQNQPHASSRGGGTAGTSSPRGGNVSAAPGNVNRQTASNNPPPSQSSSTNYTGGRSRQVKERNKGKMQQRGADKKARGGMF